MTDTSISAFLKQEYDRKSTEELLELLYRSNEVDNEDVFTLVQDILLERGGKAVKAKVAAKYLTDIVAEATAQLDGE